MNPNDDRGLIGSGTPRYRSHRSSDAFTSSEAPTPVPLTTVGVRLSPMTSEPLYSGASISEDRRVYRWVQENAGRPAAGKHATSQTGI